MYVLDAEHEAMLQIGGHAQALNLNSPVIKHDFMAKIEQIRGHRIDMEGLMRVCVKNNVLI